MDQRYLKTKTCVLFLIFFQFTIFVSAQIKIPNAVIKIYSYSQEFNPRMPWLCRRTGECTGSGFVIDGNTILTNAHVVSYSKYIHLAKQDNPKRYPATVKHISHSLDLAILEVADPSFFKDIEPLKLGGIPSLDSEVKTIGFPMGGEKISITTGIISRIESITYSHSGVDEHLAIQTDAAINPGNSGGPVLWDNAVNGVAFQGMRGGDNIGYMIPTSLVSHFLTDSKDGIIDGTPELGIFFDRLPPVMRDFLNLPENESGVLVSEVHPLSPVRNDLKKNDILSEINGYKIQDDGSIFIDNLNVPFYEVIERSQYGDEIRLAWRSDGQRHEKSFTLSRFHNALEIGNSYTPYPEYSLYAGLTFVTLNGDYMKSFGKTWWRDMPHAFRLLYYYEPYLNKEIERQCYIVLSHVLEDPGNKHAKKYINQIVDEINGKKILSFQDLKQALKHPQNGYHVIRFWKNNTPFVLEATKAEKIHKKILARNQIKKHENLKQS